LVPEIKHPQNAGEFLLDSKKDAGEKCRFEQSTLYMDVLQD
jgi:hypothetical protein